MLCERCGSSIAVLEIGKSPQHDPFCRYLPEVKPTTTWCARCRAEVHLIIERVAARARAERFVHACSVCNMGIDCDVSHGLCGACAKRVLKGFYHRTAEDDHGMAQREEDLHPGSGSGD